MFPKSVENLSFLFYFYECCWASISLAITPNQLSVTSFESIINKKVIDHFTKNNCVKNKQCGFSFSSFTANDLTTITCIISEALDDRFITRAISKAFQKVWHRSSYTNSSAMIDLEESTQLSIPFSEVGPWRSLWNTRLLDPMRSI